MFSITKDVVPSPPVRLEGLGSGQVQVPTGQVGPGLVLGVAQVRHPHLLQYKHVDCGDDVPGGPLCHPAGDRAGVQRRNTDFNCDPP